MKKKSLIISFLILALQVNAQELSLEQVLSKAKNATIYQADRQVEVEAIKLKIQQSKRIPQLFGEANLQRNLIVPTTPVPAIAFNPNAAPGEIMPLRFATDWSAKVGLQMSFDIFNPELEGNIKEAKLTQQKASIQQIDVNRDAQNELKDLYAQVVLAQEQYEVAKNVSEQYLQTLKIVKERYDAGRASEVEWNNTLKKGLELEQLEEEAAMVLLNKKIALIPHLEFDLNAQFNTPMSELVASANATQSSLERESLTLDKQINELKIKNINRLAIPKLTLNGYVGSQFFNNEFRILTSDNWYGTSFLNLALRVPITELFERNYKKQQLLIESSILDSKLGVTSSNDEVAILQKNNQLTVLRQKVQTMEKITALAESNVNSVRAQVQEGTLLISEYNKELESLFDQKKKLWQAQYDLLKKLLE